MSSDESQEVNRAYIVIGLPGSGKSTTLIKDIVEKTGAFELDINKAAQLIPEYNGGKHASIVHIEAAIITNRLFGEVLDQGYDVVIERIGFDAEQLLDLVEELHTRDYLVHLHFVDTEPLEAARRVAIRLRETGRFVDPQHVFDAGDSIKENYNKIKNDRRIAYYESLDNNVPFGQPLIKTESSIDQ